MQRRTFLRAAGLGTTTGIATLAGCGGGGDGGESDGDGGGGATTTIDMVTDGSEYYFDPIGLRVESGTTVTWRIERGAHSATAYDESLDMASVTRIPQGAEPWNSDTLSTQGESFEHTFGMAGTYDYFCIPHKTLGMVGRVVVGDPGGPAEGSMPPDGDVPESSTIVDEESVAYDDFSG